MTGNSKVTSTFGQIKNYYMKKIVWIHGLIAGFIVSTIMAISMITYYKNQELMLGTGSMIIGYLSMLISFSLIFVAIKTYRDKENDGLISFGKAFKIGMLIALIACTMYVIVWAIVYNFFVPDFMEKYSDFMIKQATGTSSAAEMQQKVAEMNEYKAMYKNPISFALITYAEILPVGILVTLISALILMRRNRKEVVLAV